MQSKSRHVEARSFGTGLTPTGPGNIPIETLQLLGGLHEIVTQAEISVNRFARRKQLACFSIILLFTGRVGGYTVVVCTHL